MAELETGHLLIREVRALDVDAFHRYMRQEQYWRDPPTAASVAALVDRCLQNQTQTPRTDYFMAAVDKRSDEPIGEAILYVRSIRWRQGEIGWGVSSSHVGRGFATEIGRAMLRLAFDTLSLHRIFAQCRVENPASRRIMAKLGMREEACGGRTCWHAATGDPRRSAQFCQPTEAKLHAAELSAAVFKSLRSDIASKLKRTAYLPSTASGGILRAWRIAQRSGRQESRLWRPLSGASGGLQSRRSSETP
jgi:ribosomal-protein-alanine N-acetyltransferase